jgi:phenylalanyl-tRNA synthetase beta chain
MKVPISWLKEFVDIEDLDLEELAHQITLAGLEVEEIHYVGLAMPSTEHRHETKITGFEWDQKKLVVGEIREVGPHPDADRLVLCRLFDGKEEHSVLTGAPNLFEYKGQGELKPALKVAYAKEGATLIDGHQPGAQMTTIKRTKIRGVESYSMVCSEKELGISDEHEGILFLDKDVKAGTPMADILGDAVFDIAITPNIARDANIYGVAREIAALTGRKLQAMPIVAQADGEEIKGKVSIEISEPELNPRFVLGLISNIEIKPSPENIQRRLSLAGMRPINNIVDATNYAMLELGEPLHAFDYDILVKRAKGKTPVISTRRAKKNEKLETLDGEIRKLDDFTVLVCDESGSLSIGGVMGGAESEVNAGTKNVLLEGAAWNFINVRKTLNAQRMSSEAAYRFSRGVHPEMAPRGVSRGLELMRQWSGGVVDKGLVDEYPLPPKASVVEITPSDVDRWLGISLNAKEIAKLLERLDFEVTAKEKVLQVQAPDHRLDIGEGVIGKADLMEEIARVYGYENIPETRIADALPPQRSNPELQKEDRIRDVLANMGLQEVITYRMTTPEIEAKRLPADTPTEDRPYMELLNPISQERTVMRQSLLASMLEIVERNVKLRERVALFEIGPIFSASEAGPLPEELSRLVLALRGPQDLAHWNNDSSTDYEFSDIKGVVEDMLAALQIEGLSYSRADHPAFHPGKSARVMQGDQQLGVFGELHPLVQGQYDLGEKAIQIGTFNMDVLLEVIPERFDSMAVPNFPPVIEDVAFIVAEELPAGELEAMIRQTGGKLLVDVKLFDIYRAEQIGKEKKSLAYTLTYQHPERTLTDKEVAKIRNKIVKRLEREMNAKLRDE